MRKVMLIVMALVMLFGFSSTAFAVEVLDQELEVIEEVTEEVTEQDSVVEYNIEFPDQIVTYQANEDDYNFADYGTYAVNGDVYAGSYNSTILSIWNGLLSNNVGKDYVAFRSSQYQYYIFFGEDFEVSGTRFSGTGNYYALNTYSNSYGYTFGSDSFSVDCSEGYLYTNVSEDFPSLDNDRGLIYEHVQTVLLIALLAFAVLRWIFICK